MKLIFFFISILLILTSCTKSKDGGIEGDLKLGGSQKADCNCIALFKPVCGGDGKTYSNSCFALCNEVKFTEGSCN